jgi:hypothetical protein
LSRWTHELPFDNENDIYARNNPDSLQEDLLKLQHWTEKWQLKFNTTKCKHLHIGKNEPGSFQLNGQEIHRVEKEKDLGVIFQNNLLFDQHISEKVNKANRMFGVIRRTFHHLDIKTFLPLYKAMVRTHLDFCASVYSPIHQRDKERIESVQRRATKQLPGMHNLSYPERLKKLKLPSLTFRRTRSNMIELLKITLNIYDEEMGNFVSLRRDEDIRSSTRHHNFTIYPLHCKTAIRKNAFVNRTLSLWNNLPAAVVNAPSLNAFKLDY